MSWKALERNSRLVGQATLYEFRKRTAFRTGFLIKEVLQGISRPAIMIAVYWAIFNQDGVKEFGGYRFIDLAHYLILAAMFQKLIFNNHGLDLANQIFEGYITKYFTMPFHYFILALGRFYQYVTVQVVVAFLFYGIGLLFLPQWWPVPVSLVSVLQAITLSLFGSYCFFLLYYIINTFAFWLDVIWSFLAGAWFISCFISGTLIPVSLMPVAFQNIFYWSFPYWTIFAPVEIFMGRRNDFWAGFLVLLGTFFVLECLRRLFWKWGVRKYSGSGM